MLMPDLEEDLGFEMVKPKRPKSGYFYFLESKRDYWRDKFPKMKMTERQKIMSREWAQMDPAIKQSFENAAVGEKEEYRRKMAVYKEWERKRNEARKRKYEAMNPKQKAMPIPKRPRPAYLFFLSHERAACSAEYPDASVGEITRILSKAWRELTPEDKKIFDEQAARDKERYRAESAKFDKYLGNLSYQQNPAEWGMPPADPEHLTLPTAKVKKIATADKSLSCKFSKDAIWLVTKATELFIQNFSSKIKQKAARSGRKMLLPKDFVAPLKQNESLGFLREPFKLFIKELSEKQEQGLPLS